MNLNPARSIATLKYEFAGGDTSVTISIPGLKASSFVMAQLESSNAVGPGVRAVTKTTPSDGSVRVFFTADPGASVITLFVATGPTSQIPA